MTNREKMIEIDTTTTIANLIYDLEQVTIKLDIAKAELISCKETMVDLINSNIELINDNNMMSNTIQDYIKTVNKLSGKHNQRHGHNRPDKEH